MPSGDVPHLRFPYADKWVHAVLYLGFSVLWALSFPGGGLLRLLLIVALGCLLGYLIEVLQGAVTSLGRSYDPFDLLADAAGAVVGAIAYGVMVRVGRQRYPGRQGLEP